MKRGLQTNLAKTLGTTPQRINNLLAGRRNARPPAARRLAQLTQTDPFLWMQGGLPGERQRAVEQWAARNLSNTPVEALAPEQL